MCRDGEVIAGRNAVIQTISSKTVNKLFLNKERKDKELLSLAKSKNIPTVFVDKTYLDKISNHANHQGVVCITSPIDYLELNDLIKKNQDVKYPMILMLDEVQDVNNLGAIMRIVDAFNINGIIINKRRSAPVNATVSKISTGAINHVDICRVNNLSQAIDKLKASGYFIVALDMVGEQTTKSNDYQLPLVVVVGGEDKGVTKMMKKLCDYSINIPMGGHVNSLNVSSAVSIICYEKYMSSLS